MVRGFFFTNFLNDPSPSLSLFSVRLLHGAKWMQQGGHVPIPPPATTSAFSFPLPSTSPRLEGTSTAKRKETKRWTRTWNKFPNTSTWTWRTGKERKCDNCNIREQKNKSRFKFPHT